MWRRWSWTNCCPRADFITLHTPLTDSTRNILSAEALAKTKRGVRIVNCARGGLIDEAALKAALESGQVAGAALDVFAEEPAKANPLFGTPNFISTPHLGASTSEAQVNVAIQVAEQMADYLVNGGIANALNMPALSAEDAPRVRPYMALADRLGSLVGQLAHGALSGVSVEVEGAAAELPVKPITGAVLAGLMRTYSDTVNMVNAPVMAREPGHGRARGAPRAGGARTTRCCASRSTRPTAHVRSLAPCSGRDEPRLVEIFGVKVEADLAGPMLYVVNTDEPGFIGRLGTALGQAGVNIGTFHLGRRATGGEAVVLCSLDSAVDEDVLATVRALPGVRMVRALAFG